MKVMTIFHINRLHYIQDLRLGCVCRRELIFHTKQMQKIGTEESHMVQCHANLISAAWIYRSHKQ